MARLDILQEPKKETVKASMEAALENVEQYKTGNMCDYDAVHALDVLKEKGFFTRASRDHIVIFEGPVIYYNHVKGKLVRADHHTVGQINEDWVIDLASKPGHRIYFNLEDYKENSGMKLPNPI